MDLFAQSARKVSARRAAAAQSIVLREAWTRGKWLLGLLALQSMSSVVLGRYQVNLPQAFAHCGIDTTQLRHFSCFSIDAATSVPSLVQALLEDHLVVTLFLTMLVGAGGNAGNQSAIKVRFGADMRFGAEAS